MASTSSGPKAVRATDPNFEEVVLKWFEETETYSSDDDIEDRCETSEHDSASELEIASQDENLSIDANDSVTNVHLEDTIFTPAGPFAGDLCTQTRSGHGTGIKQVMPTKETVLH
ncbi:hypothetical protein FQR65_LT11223 [Abscondita terminalis]|nr:hypothetical protein FQR65_LT11223 [Abscondita terminalis]